MSKISGYPPITNVQPDDVLIAVDVHDITMAASGTDKKITLAQVHSPAVAVVNWVNAVTQYQADNTGATDASAAILNAIAAARLVYLPAGTYLLNGAAALALTVAGSGIIGDFFGATKIVIGGSFSAAWAISIAAANCSVTALSIVGASSTIASNPACNGIEIQPGSDQYTIQGVFTQYINGWSLEGSNSSGHPDISHSVVDKFWSYNCAGSIHYDGNLGSGAQSTVGVTLSNISIGGGGTATGANANLDAILLESCSDLIWSNCLIGVGSAGTGHCIHIKGNCSAVWFNGFDAGGYPGTLASSQCGVLIENDTFGDNAQRIRFSSGVFQTFGQGAQITGLAQQIGFKDVQFINNVTHGCQLGGTGTQINFAGCTFSGNGSGAAGSNYDLYNSGGAQGTVRDCHFLTETGVTIGAGPGVQYTVGIGGGVALNFEHNDFRGTLAAGSYLTYSFSNLPHIIRNNANVNPWGSATVTVPASGSASGALHYDATFYITGSITSYAFTATNASPCVFTATGSSYANGNQVQLSGASLPAGFTAGTTYFVVSASGTTFELSATSGGSAINSTSTGSGTVAAVCSIMRNTNAQGGGAGPAVIIPPGGCVAVSVPAATNITPTYATGSAPTWVVDGM